MPKAVSMLEMMKAKNGDILRIKLTDEKCAFAQLFCEGHFIAFFDYSGDCNVGDLKVLVNRTIAFIDYVHITAVRDGRWKIIGNLDILDELKKTFQICRPEADLDSSDVWRLSTVSCGKKIDWDEVNVSREQCTGIRRSRATFWLIEDELRERFLGLPPQSYDDNGDLNKELKQFLMSTIPGSPAVIGEFGTLGNDQAQDWLNGVLMPTEDLSALQEVLQSNQTGYMQVDDCFEILAAAEVLLALMGKGRKGTKELAEEWLIGVRQKKLHNSAEAKALVSKALAAIDRVLDKDNSELFQLMSEGPGVPNPDWLNGVEDLKARLAKLGY